MKSTRFRKRMLARSWSPWMVIGIILCGLWSARTQNPTDTAGGSVGEVIITARAIRHIQERHWPDSPAQGAGKFSPGITEDSLRQLVNQAVANGRVRPNSHGRPGEIYEYDFGHPIGINIEGGPAYRLRVVVDRWNQLITAFPF